MNLSKGIQEEVKATLRGILSRNEDITDISTKEFNALSSAVVNAIKAIRNPTEKLTELRKGIYRLLAELDEHIKKQKLAVRLDPHDPEHSSDVADMIDLENGETLRLMHSRWKKLYDDLWDEKNETFDISKIPDVYDCCKYDAIHTQPRLGLKELENTYKISRQLSEFVAPSEYGLTRRQRLDIGSTICRNLIDKISIDIESALLKPKMENEEAISESDDENEGTLRLNPDFMNDEDFIDHQIKTRLYFTSESHVHSILNTLRYYYHVDSQSKRNAVFSPESQLALNVIPEFDYLSQIVFKVYENLTVAETDSRRYFMRIGVSPGVAGNCIELHEGSCSARVCQPLQWLSPDGEILRAQTFLRICKKISQRVDQQRDGL